MVFCYRLVFSQSLLSLNLIESFLEFWDEEKDPDKRVSMDIDVENSSIDLHSVATVNWYTNSMSVHCLSCKHHVVRTLNLIVLQYI